MRRTTLFTIALLALTLTSAAWADSPADRYGQHGGDGRYDSYGRQGRYPGRDDIGRVAALAHQLERTAAYVHREFERNNRRPSRSEERVAVTLHALNEDADRFHAQVESYRQDPRRTERDFQQLLDAYYRAADSLRYIRPRGYVERGMNEIGGLISELTRYYGRYDEHSRWGRGHGYDGRGRDGSGRYDDHDNHDWDGDRRPPR